MFMVFVQTWHPTDLCLPISVLKIDANNECLGFYFDFWNIFDIEKQKLYENESEFDTHFKIRLNLHKLFSLDQKIEVV